MSNREDLVAERRAEAVEHRCSYEELPGRTIQPREDLVREVLRDVALTPGKLARTPSWIVLFTQPERGEIQGHRPPLGSLGEEGDLLPTEVESLGSDEELPGLVLRERQIGGTQLAENAAAPESSEGEARIDARSGDHSYSMRKVLERILEEFEALVVLDDVEIVQDDRERRCSSEVAEELL